MIMKWEQFKELSDENQKEYMFRFGRVDKPHMIADYPFTFTVMFFSVLTNYLLSAIFLTQTPIYSESKEAILNIINLSSSFISAAVVMFAFIIFISGILAAINIHKERKWIKQIM